MDDDGAADLFADALSTSYAFNAYTDNNGNDANRNIRGKRSTSAAAAAVAAAPASTNNNDVPSTNQRPQWQLVTRLHASLCAEAVLLAQGAPPVVASRALLRINKLPAGPATDVAPGDGSSAAAAASAAGVGMGDDEDAASLRRLLARQHPEIPPYRAAGVLADGDEASAAAANKRRNTSPPPSPAALLDVDLVLECVMEEAALARKRAAAAHGKLFGEQALPPPRRVLTATATTAKGKRQQASAAAAAAVGAGQGAPSLSPAEVELRRHHAWSTTGPLILEFLKR